jgi:hypothetical protein
VVVALGLFGCFEAVAHRLFAARTRRAPLLAALAFSLVAVPSALPFDISMKPSNVVIAIEGRYFIPGSPASRSP